MSGDRFSPDVPELIATLAKHDVRFLLVGGEAVIYHGYPRLTDEADFLYDQTAENASRLSSACANFAAEPFRASRPRTSSSNRRSWFNSGGPPHRSTS